MSPHLTWSKLVPGLIALGLVVAIAAAVLVFAGVGRVRGETIRLHVVTDQARGLMNGSDVWLNGQRIGTVTHVGFLPPSVDTSARVVVSVEVEADDAVQIRRNSDVQIRAGGNVIGPIVVYIAAGTATSPRVANGDTLRAESQSDFEVASSKLGLAADELGPMIADAKMTMARVHDRSGTIGAALNGSANGEVARLRANVSRLGRRAGGRVGGDGSLMATARVALARVDSVRALLGSPNTSYGRFKRDSTLSGVIAGVRDELASIRALMDSSGGTLARVRSDSAIVRQITIARREMAELFADVRRHPSRYIAF